MTAQLIEGRKIAAGIKEELKKEIEGLKEQGIEPRLTSIQVGDDPGSNVYIRSQRKSCEKMGIDYQLHKLEEGITQDELVSFIEAKTPHKAAEALGGQEQ